MIPVDPDSKSDVASRASGVFRTTHWSAVLAASQGQMPGAEEALGQLCAQYWYPLYAYIRRRGYGPHDAEDLTQEFFAQLLEKHFLEGITQEGGKFRSFLLTALNASSDTPGSAPARRSGEADACRGPSKRRPKPNTN